MSKPGVFSSVIAWLDERAPHDPRILRLLDFLLPLLITGLLVASLLQIGRVGTIAEEARNSSRTAQRATRANHRFSAELREGLVGSCEKNGNPLREAEVEDQREAITDPQDPRLRELLPDVPAQVIERIAAEENEHHRERMAKLRPVDCEAQYPRPDDGTSAPRR